VANQCSSGGTSPTAVETEQPDLRPARPTEKLPSGQRITSKTRMVGPQSRISLTHVNKLMSEVVPALIRAINGTATIYDVSTFGTNWQQRPPLILVSARRTFVLCSWDPDLAKVARRSRRPDRK